MYVDSDIMVVQPTKMNTGSGVKICMAKPSKKNQLNTEKYINLWDIC